MVVALGDALAEGRGPVAVTGEGAGVVPGGAPTAESVGDADSALGLAIGVSEAEATGGAADPV